MDENPRVVASVVTYRSSIPLLRDTLITFNQCRLKKQIYLVDNHSGQDYVRELRTMHHTKVILSKTNAGFGAGHNLAIAQAPLKYDYHLILNPDVVIHDGTLESMVSYMDRNPQIGLLVPKVLFPEGDLQYLNKRLPTVFDLFARRFMPRRLRELAWVQEKMEHYEMRDVGYTEAVDVPFCSGCFMLIRKKALEAVQGFDEKFFLYLEDCDMTRRIADAGYRCVYYPHATITHHWMRGSHKSWKLMWVMVRSSWYYFRKWGWKWL